MSAEPPPEPSALQRATNRQGSRGTWRDPRLWRAEFGERVWPAMLLVAIFVAVLVAEWVEGDLTHWGLSAQALREGRWYTIVGHMFAHAGLAHLWMNSTALLSMTSPVMMRLGAGRTAWPRFALLYFGSGLAGAAVYLALHPNGVVPMVGASGAIFGLWGALARIGQDGGVVPLRSRQVWLNVRQVAIINAVLFVLLFVLSAGQGGLAWEGHLGGFLFGLLVTPRLVVPPRTRAGLFA